MLRAGYKVNVIPQVASAEVDGRFLPGYEEEFLAELDRVLGPGIQREFIHRDIALETTFDGDLVAAMSRALLPRTRPPGSSRTACPAGPTPSRLPGSVSGASDSRRSGFHLIWTFPECSMA